MLEETEQLATHHERVADSPDDPAHEVLRYAVLKLFEDDASNSDVGGSIVTVVCPTGGMDTRLN